jgi:hypothetical protein
MYVNASESSRTLCNPSSPLNFLSSSSSFVHFSMRPPVLGCVEFIFTVALLGTTVVATGSNEGCWDRLPATRARDEVECLDSSVVWATWMAVLMNVSHQWRSRICLSIYLGFGALSPLFIAPRARILTCQRFYRGNLRGSNPSSSGSNWADRSSHPTHRTNRCRRPSNRGEIRPSLDVHAHCTVHCVCSQRW